jgi:bifunctional DNA-binding transcriptional regulator/antitoxin component of YhaV-PrlF toxin-antitoxin module
MVKLLKANGNGSTIIVIPKVYREMLGWAHGDCVVIDMNLKKNTLTISKGIKNENRRIGN